MAEGMHRLNVVILAGPDEITYWTGSPSQEGGALRAIDMSPVGGPPVYDYDTTGDDRDQMKFNLDTKIPGADATAQNAFIATYERGTIFENASISGLPAGYNWIIENRSIRHNAEGNAPSILSIVLAEHRPYVAPGP